MNDRELRAAAIGIITYCHMCQTGEMPELDPGNQILEAAAVLDNAILDKVLEICSYADLDEIEFAEIDGEE